MRSERSERITGYPDKGANPAKLPQTPFGPMYELPTIRPDLLSREENLRLQGNRPAGSDLAWPSWTALLHDKSRLLAQRSLKQPLWGNPGEILQLLRAAG